MIDLFWSMKKYWQGSGEYIDGGGVGGVFSLLILGSIIVGRTKTNGMMNIDMKCEFYLVRLLDRNDKD